MTKHLWAIAVVGAVVAACGGTEGGGGARPRSTIQIVPSAVGNDYSGADIEYFVAGDPTTPIVTWAEDFVTVAVSGPNGAPQRQVDVRLYHLGPGTMANINRVLQDEPYVTQTDDFGNVYLYIYTPTYDTVGATSTDFEAFSGSAFQKMTVTMTCADSNTSTTRCD